MKLYPPVIGKQWLLGSVLALSASLAQGQTTVGPHTFYVDQWGIQVGKNHANFTLPAALSGICDKRIVWIDLQEAGGRAQLSSLTGAMLANREVSVRMQRDLPEQDDADYCELYDVQVHNPTKP